jgi:hypothetical protein
MITTVYSTIIESAKVACHWKNGRKPRFLPTTCPKQKLDASNEWVQILKIRLCFKSNFIDYSIKTT